MRSDVLLTTTQGRVRLLTMNRPQALNSLNHDLSAALATALQEADEDAAISCTILRGGEKAFAAGADIKELAALSSEDIRQNRPSLLTFLDRLASLRKPIIAEVSGYALGGGCELALLCDIIVASQTARFGQPEITLATIPGIGGTQRLLRAIGKSRAMLMCLTGEMMSAQDAYDAGLIAKICAAEELAATSMAIAEKIASLSLPAVICAKQAIKRAEEVGLTQGCIAERNLFAATFDLKDQSEGMQAFIEKRRPQWSHR